MATKNSSIKVTIVGDADEVKKAFREAAGAGDDFEKSTGGLSSKVSGSFKAIGAAAGGFLAADAIKGAVGFIGDAISKASDLGETVSKNQTIFGDAYTDLDKWANDAPKSLGITKAAALDATGTFGNMFTQLGITTDQAREMSKSNVQLATDFASFHNADPTEILESMSAAFRGEYDSLQKYVPLINAASVEQKALAMTGKASKDELTAQEKALAVNTLMMEGAGQAVGDFARTSDSASNRQKILRAEMEQQQTALGSKLLPAYTALLGFITNTALPAITSFTGFLQEHKEVAIALGLMVAAVVVPPMIAWAAATLAATWPIVAIGVAIAALVAGVIYAYNHFDWFRGAVDAVGAAIKWVYNWVTDNWPTLLAVLTGPFGVAVLLITKNWDTIKDGATGAYNWVVQKFEDIKNWFFGFPGKVLNAVGNIKDILYNIGKDIINGLWNGLKEKWESVKNWLGGVGSAIKNLKGPIEQDRVLLVDEGNAIMEGFHTGLVQGWKPIEQWVQNIGGAIVQGFSKYGSSATGAVQTAYERALSLVGAGVSKDQFIAGMGGSLWGLSTDEMIHIGTYWGGRYVADSAATWAQISDTPFATGGIATKPIRGLVGEAGPEAIIPLDKLERTLGGSTYNVTLNVPPGTNMRRAGREFRRYLNESDRTAIR